MTFIAVRSYWLSMLICHLNSITENICESFNLNYVSHMYLKNIFRRLHATMSIPASLHRMTVFIFGMSKQRIRYTHLNCRIKCKHRYIEMVVKTNFLIRFYFCVYWDRIFQDILIMMEVKPEYHYRVQMYHWWCCYGDKLNNGTVSKSIDLYRSVKAIHKIL